MFICPITNKCTRPGEKMRRITVETREKIYSKRVRDMETGKLNTVQVGKGFEIVKELGVSEEGEKIWYETHPLDKTG